MQIPLLTCPSCFRTIVNPNAAPEPLARTTVKRSKAPRQVIPVEQEAAQGIRGTSQGIFFLAACLEVGGILMVPFSPLISVLLIVCGVLVAAAGGALSKRAPEMHERASRRRARHSADGKPVIDYSDLPDVRPEISYDAYVSGFFYAIVVSFLIFLALSAAKSGRHTAGFVTAAVVALVILIYLAFQANQDPEQNGFVSGVTMGLVLGAVGCGPCALFTVLS